MSHNTSNIINYHLHKTMPVKCVYLDIIKGRNMTIIHDNIIKNISIHDNSFNNGNFPRIITGLINFSKNYTFNVDSILDIRKKAIYDELSYTNPLSIMEYDGKTFAFVHHTIFNKYCRSEMHNYYDIGKLNKIIVDEYGEINPRKLKDIINQIKMIKQAKWRKEHKKGKIRKYPVTVKQVKI